MKILYKSLTLITALTLAGSAVAESAVRSARILDGWREGDGTHVAALELVLQSGWKTYWRAPGDTGIPPTFDWTGSEGLESYKVIWPAPVLFHDAGVLTVGYKERLVLPLKFHPTKPGGNIRLNGQVNLGVCKDICVPVELKISQDLSAVTVKRDAAIVSALVSVPDEFSRQSGKPAGKCTITPDDDGITVRSRIDIPQKAGDEYSVIESGNHNLYALGQKTQRSGSELISETTFYHLDPEGAVALDRGKLKLTVINSDGIKEYGACLG